jgi:pyruvate dehydrogenase E1 component alpha subunit
MTTPKGAPARDGETHFTPEEELAAYRAMLLIRRFEEKAGQLYALGEIHGLCPLSIGQEASIVGTIMAASPADRVIAGSRCHGQMLALGIAPERIMAELMGRTSGISKGKGGTFHMYARDERFFGGHLAPGHGVPLGAGLAFASKYRGDGAVCLCFYGEDAAGKGTIVETYKIAADWKLPIVFIIDNNAGAPGASIALGAIPSAVAQAGVPFAIHGEQVDGIDVCKVFAAARSAIERARRGEGPTILEMLTYRYRGHDAASTASARSAEKRRDEADPVAKARARIVADRIASESAVKAIEKDVRETVNAAAASARAAPRPGASELHTSTLA